MSTENKDRLALRMGPDTRRKIDQWYAATGCRSRNQFADSVRNVKRTNGRLSFEEKIYPEDRVGSEWPN